LQPGSVISLTGPLGSGKTILVKGIASGLHIKQSITSPSFTIISEYEGSLPLYHIDLYRIRSDEELELLGVEELLYSGGVSIIEWGEKAATILPDYCIYIYIELGADNHREIRIEGIEL
jgi:tRNA threonylcarbamoyladenosine biosynthesis protein TsaE